MVWLYLKSSAVKSQVGENVSRFENIKNVKKSSKLQVGHKCQVWQTWQYLTYFHIIQSQVG